MGKEKDIRDDEIRIIGGVDDSQQTKRKQWLWVTVVVAVAVIGITMWRLMRSECEFTETAQSEPTYFEPHDSLPVIGCDTIHYIGRIVEAQVRGFSEIIDTTINDVLLRLFIPHNAEISLHVGPMDRQDSTIIYAAQAADVRRDNGKIVGAFVLNGEPLAWGLSKKGFCAVIDGKVTIGVADNSPLFEEATGRGGYFFRQYPLVKDGVLVENEPKNKSVRRALCDRYGEIFMVESLTRESFHDFAQALVDLGVDQALYLVGANAYGWAIDEHGMQHEFGENNYCKEQHRMTENINYIVWKRR